MTNTRRDYYKTTMDRTGSMATHYINLHAENSRSEQSQLMVKQAQILSDELIKTMKHVPVRLNMDVDGVIEPGVLIAATASVLAAMMVTLTPYNEELKTAKLTAELLPNVVKHFYACNEKMRVEIMGMSAADVAEIKANHEDDAA